MAATQTPTTMPTATPSNTWSHRGASVTVPVTKPKPTIQAPHAPAPITLNTTKRRTGTPARPAAPAPAVRPNGTNRAAMMAAPLVEPMRVWARRTDRAIRRPNRERSSTPGSLWRPRA